MTSRLTVAVSPDAKIGGQLAGQAATRHRQRAGGRFRFAATSPYGEFNGGRDVARAVEDRHRDRRSAALDSLRDVAICVNLMTESLCGAARRAR